MPSIVQARIRDATRIRQLALDSGIDAWTETDYVNEIRRNDSVVTCSFDSNQLVGFLVARVVPGVAERPDAELYNIAVHDAFRRSGVGSSLMADLIKRLAGLGVGDVWLEVRESNLPAIRFYELHGFVAEVVRPNFYADPIENAVIMRLAVHSCRDVTEP